MNLTQIKYFRETVICGSVTSAAHRLGVSQPAVSKQLTSLARELNCKLWIKHNRKLRLTESGRILFQRSELILEQLRLLKNDITQINSANEISGSITVGCGPLLSRALMPDLSIEFIRKYPKVNLSIYESDSVLLAGLLTEGTIDIGLGAGNLNKKNKEIKFTSLLKDEYLVIHSSELIIPGEIFPLDEFYRHPFINYIPGSTIMASLGEKLKLKKLNSIFHVRNTETVIEFVKRNAGIAFMPSYLYKLLRPEGVITKHLKKPIFQNIGIYHYAKIKNKPVYKAFETRVKKAFNAL
jgi:DNA-binding transcriptional LysR family regulator